MSEKLKNKYRFLEDAVWQEFILNNYNKPLEKLLLSLNKKEGVDNGLLANQLHARQVIEEKIPNWKNHKKLIFPKKVNMEQCSSELTARYKSQIIKGQNCIDLTGGLGVDSFFLSQSFEHSIHCELDEELQFIATKNFKVLNASIQSFHSDGLSHLKRTEEYFDLIYLDPSRRNKDNNKVVLLDEYTPNILMHLKLLANKGKHILLKTSPLLDLKQAIEQLPGLQEIHVLALNNECKELLFLISTEQINKQPLIVCKDLIKDISFTFKLEEEQVCRSNLSYPQRYIYEPNVSILKAGAFKSIASRYKLFKLHANSHLYTSDIQIANFPGRCFKLNAICHLNKKEILPLIEGSKANISKRNFPNTVAEIRKKLGLNEGGTDYLLATTLMDEKKRILVCTKV